MHTSKQLPDFSGWQNVEIHRIQRFNAAMIMFLSLRGGPIGTLWHFCVAMPAIPSYFIGLVFSGVCYHALSYDVLNSEMAAAKCFAFLAMAGGVVHSTVKLDEDPLLMTHPGGVFISPHREVCKAIKEIEFSYCFASPITMLPMVL